MNTASRTRTSLRRSVRLGVLALVATALGTLWIDSYLLQRSFHPVAEAYAVSHIDETARQAHISTVARMYGVVGPAVAKLELFMVHDVHADIPSHGLAYHFERVGGDWGMRDSGHCTSEQCIERGVEAFDALARMQHGRASRLSIRLDSLVQRGSEDAKNE